MDPCSRPVLPRMRLGSDVLFASDRLRGARVGIVCNHASVDHAFRHVIDRLIQAQSVTLAGIFGPQHGFRSDVQDNMVETPHQRDEARRVPVYSLYSETREPTLEMLRDIDTLVIDLQDIGARIYTASTRWPIACARRPATVFRLSCATGRTRLAGPRSKVRASWPGSSRSSASFPSRCATE